MEVINPLKFNGHHSIRLNLVCDLMAILVGDRNFTLLDSMLRPDLAHTALNKIKRFANCGQ